MTTHVFVYGTLRRGEGNHRLLVESRFVRQARTVPAFRLLDLGAYPALLEGGGTSVLGEVYEVDELTLGVLDRLEGHPGFYRREPIELEDGAVVEAYLLPDAQAWSRRVITSGDWKSRKGGAA